MNRLEDELVGLILRWLDECEVAVYEAEYVVVDRDADDEG